MADASSVCLDGLAATWDESRELRQILRANGSLFQTLPGRNSLDHSVDAAGYNKDALLPVMKLLRNPSTDEIGMVSIPALEAECLNNIWLV